MRTTLLGIALLALTLGSGCVTRLSITGNVPGPASPPGTWTVLERDREPVSRIFSYKAANRVILRLEVFAPSGYGMTSYFGVNPDGTLEHATDEERVVVETALYDAILRGAREPVP